MAHAASKRVAHATVFTAFTSDYELGHLTLPYNRQYADRHGYDFVARIRPPFDWSLPGERHPSWDKVAILLELLDEHLDSPQHGKSATHILWVDADAVVIHQELSIDDLWADLPNSCELLLGEDVAPACLLNAGVFIVRVSEWSRQLWREVWGCQAAVRFHKRLYWEQSVLISVLIECGEGLERVKPFHSYRGGPELKVFDHVCVLPRHAFNTNRAHFGASAGGSTSKQHRCDFVFHAAGAAHCAVHETCASHGAGCAASCYHPSVRLFCRRSSHDRHGTWSHLATKQETSPLFCACPPPVGCAATIRIRQCYGQRSPHRAAAALP